MKFCTVLNGLFVCAALATQLGGCGVETATTAATAAKVKTEEAKAAKQQLDQVKQQLDAAAQQAEAQKKAMDEATK